MLAAIGETLENSEEDGEVMGVVVNVRKGFYRIGLWTKTVGKSVPGGGEGDVAGGKGRSLEKSKEILMGLGRRFKVVLQLKAAEQVEFSGHTEVQPHSNIRRSLIHLRSRLTQVVRERRPSTLYDDSGEDEVVNDDFAGLSTFGDSQ